MAQRNNARIDRFAQMTKQEEIIAKKRQEILEKQRTAQLAKAVAAAQSLAAKLKSDVNEAETSGGDTAIGVDNKSVESSSSIANADSVIPNELAAAIDKSDACVKGKKEDSSESAIAKPLNSLTGKTGKISFGLKRLHTQVPVAEQPPPKVVNSFCNDGSFLENFKKILEKHEPKPTQTTLTPELKADDLATEPASVTQANESAAEEDSQKQNETSVELNQGQLPMGQTAAPSVPPISQSGIQQTLQHPIMTSMSQPSMPHHQHPHQLQQSMAPSPQQHMRAFPPPQPAQHPSLSSLQPQVQPPIQHQVQQANILPPTQPPFLFNHHPPQPPPVPPPHPMSAAFFAAAPPPPPPPQLPMTLALGPLYMIPAPEPLQLNTIPAPKEFDLNAIPKPQMNVEAIQMPHGVQQSHQQVLQVQQQIQQQQQQQHQHLQLQQQQQKTEQLLQMQQIHNTLEDSVKPPPPPPHLPRQLQQLQSQLPPKLQHTQQLNQQTPPPPPPPQPQPQQQRQEEQEQEQQQADREHENSDQSPVFSDNNDHSCSSIQLPTTVEHLIELVGENGDGYEDKIRLHKNELDLALWFLFEKNCEQYRNYRQQLIGHRRRLEHTQQEPPLQSQPQQLKQSHSLTQLQNQDSLEMDEESSESGGPQEHQHESLYLYHQRQRQLKLQSEQQAAESAQQNDVTDKYDPESAISGDVDSDDEYMRGMLDRNRDNIKRRIECRNELSEEERQEREAEAELEEQRRLERKKQRKSRWGEKVQASTSTASDMMSNVPTSFANQNKPMLSTVTRNDPALLQYARLNYGSTNLSEEDWKKCEEHYKVNLLYQDMIRKRQEIDRLARSGKFKYEYDSDEDVDGGTWEHKLRCAEMEATKLWATALTKQSEGKHHIGDFLPPEELKKFMEQYEAKKNNRQPDLSDYKEYKLKEDNIGFQMLQKLGWKEGQGLGTDGAGIVDPVNKAPQRDGNQGLGVASAATPEECDNEYDAYRKRMMLAYRFRPNPLNNPRRAYY